jgi:ribonuclease VapC
VAILGREPGHEELEKRLATSGGPFFISPLVKFEASVALARLKSIAGKRKASSDTLRQAQRAVDAFVEDVAAEEIPITTEIGGVALDACVAYGKAVGHAADLNFGDCFSYACTKALKTSLLYKGNDFSSTDLA